jgi:hypothetical protein
MAMGNNTRKYIFLPLIILLIVAWDEGAWSGQVRDVVNARTTIPSCLDNMHILLAPTIERGVSQLPDV